KFNLPADRVQAHVAEGSPKDKILEMAKKLPADMVIIASHRPDKTKEEVPEDVIKYMRDNGILIDGLTIDEYMAKYGDHGKLDKG
ncbi:universal stress protein, partial [Salmonella enterica subsp. enterica serovar Kentucky]|nr:universal stress protein [Salmonella enterica subsp. enterica serovar Kentucky]